MKKLYGILCIMLCLFVAGCDDDSEKIDGGFGIVDRDVKITAAGGSVVVTVSEPGVKAESNETWCAVSVDGLKVTVTLAPNLGLEGRTAQVTLAYQAEKTSFPVTQPGNRIPIPDTKTVSFEAVGGEVKVFVESAMPFTAASSSTEWLDVQVEGDSLVLVAGLNMSSTARSAKVTLTSGTLEAEMTISQAGLVLTPEKTVLSVSNAGGTSTVKVNSTLPYTATSNQTWVTPTVNGGTLSLKVDKNPGTGDRIAIVTLASEGGLTAKITITQSLYADFIGNWTITGTGSDNNPLTYDISVAQGVVGTSYKVTGWGKSIVATDSKYAVTMNFDKESGLVFITAQEAIAVYSDAGDNYDVQFYGQVMQGGKFLYVSGGGYVCYIGELQGDGTVKWYGGEVTLAGGAKYDIYGARYFIKDKITGDVLGFNVDAPFMTVIGTTMRKASSSASVMAVPAKSSKSKTLETSSLKTQ